MNPKYSYEAGLNVYTSYKRLVPVELLQEIEKIDNRKYHIYGILAYSQMYFEKKRLN